MLFLARWSKGQEREKGGAGVKSKVTGIADAIKASPRGALGRGGGGRDGVMSSVTAGPHPGEGEPRPERGSPVIGLQTGCTPDLPAGRLLRERRCQCVSSTSSRPWT